MSRDLFIAQWIPEAGKSQLYRSFMDLKQGNMTFSEYEKKFNELSKFGPSLIDSPLKKNENFIKGARQEYYDRLTAHVHGSFASLMDMAIQFEDGKTHQQGKASADQSTSSYSGKRKRN